MIALTSVTPGGDECVGVPIAELHTRKGEGSDGTTPSSLDSTWQCVRISAFGTLTHSSPRLLRVKRYTRNAWATHCAGAEKQAEACVALAEG
jgi:hypothetical protein